VPVLVECKRCLLELDLVECKRCMSWLNAIDACWNLPCLNATECLGWMQEMPAGICIGWMLEVSGGTFWMNWMAVVVNEFEWYGSLWVGFECELTWKESLKYGWEHGRYLDAWLKRNASHVCRMTVWSDKCLNCVPELTACGYAWGLEAMA
jgi:hypothetical protein